MSVPAGLELCDLPHRLTVATVAVWFAVGAESLLPGVALACHSWQLLQASSTLPLVLLLPYWWWVNLSVYLSIYMDMDRQYHPLVTKPPDRCFCLLAINTRLRRQLYGHPLFLFCFVY